MEANQQGTAKASMPNYDLVGVGLYTPIEAQRLLGIPAAKISRWLRGHDANGKHYEPLWSPQIDLQDGAVYLGFRDLMEMRTAHQFMDAGVSAQAIRRTIYEARKYVEDERPLSTTKFKTDGRTIFLEIADEENDKKLLDLFKKQYAFAKIIERSLRDVEFEGITPSRWWIGSKRSGVVVDPQFSFGQPVEVETHIPTAVLAKSVEAEGSIEAAARAWCVDRKHIKRALDFEEAQLKAAA